MSSKDGKMAVALVGGGTIAPLHAEYLLSSPTCSLVAIIDPFLPGKELAFKLSVLHFDSIENLRDSCSTTPEAYIICVPSNLHISVAQELLNTMSPKAILIEKPFCTDSKSGESFLRTAKSKKCTILVGHHRRFHPSLVRARQVINSGQIGKITAISGSWTVKKNDGYYTFAEWRGSRSAGGGPIWTNFVHDIDVLHYLTGSNVIRVWATGTISHRSHPGIPKDDKVEEGAAIMLQFANGIVGTFIVSDNVESPFGWEAATGDNPLYPPAPVKIDCYRIFGTHGTLTEPDGAIWQYNERDAKELKKEIGWNVAIRREQLSLSDQIPFKQQIENLSRVTRGLEEAHCSGDDGLNAVRVCEAVVKALKLGDGLPIELH
ncbi:hypothetical protein N7462_001104 [Penicillium macrosclerotiorum]|uniref:uncharacterized protein n=1 Tax=Penicillium macrosclerotiorum TaxID=303699 RepID=UPI0025473FCB|nr:uncharacterized protein N7462_001104 [Penicillium macrosclerotiorum]KAJ5699099.1 hypothetical protein N7462_001104 [Penicillium macrosclerotiorum]